LAGALLDAEAKMGELLKVIPKQGKTKEYGSSGGTIPTLPEGITKKQSHIFQTLAEHKDITGFQHRKVVLHINAANG
jgi:DNA mismatch repair protein MutH